MKTFGNILGINMKNKLLQPFEIQLRWHEAPWNEATSFHTECIVEFVPPLIDNLPVAVDSDDTR